MHLLLQFILGDYEFKTFGRVFEEALALGRGLATTGMVPRRNILIFAETRADWIVAALACFRQNFPGESSCHSNSQLSTYSIPVTVCVCSCDCVSVVVTVSL